VRSKVDQESPEDSLHFAIHLIGWLFDILEARRAEIELQPSPERLG
jgi:hypothetical protein